MMPCYSFAVFDGRTEPERERTELSDQGRARCEAVRLMEALLKEGSTVPAAGEEWRVEVADEEACILYRLSFHLQALPVVAQGMG